VEQVKNAVDLAKVIGRPIATPAEVRAMLGLDPAKKDRVLMFCEPNSPLFPGECVGVESEWESLPVLSNVMCGYSERARQ
jgi:hypothetical protein